jgi:hypothetical protein
MVDATTAVRDESSRTHIRKFSETTKDDIVKLLKAQAGDAAKALASEKVAAADMEFTYQVDVRYHGQGLRLTVDVDLKRLEKEGLDAIRRPFDEEHTRLFTFAMPLEHEFVALRAVVQGKGISIRRQAIARGGPSPAAAAVGRQKSYMDGKDCTATVYDRARYDLSLDYSASLDPPFSEADLVGGILEPEERPGGGHREGAEGQGLERGLIGGREDLILEPAFLDEPRRPHGLSGLSAIGWATAGGCARPGAVATKV